MIGKLEYNGMNPLAELVADLVMDDNLTLVLDVHGADAPELEMKLHEAAAKADVNRTFAEERLEGRRLVFNISNGSTLMLTLIREDTSP